MRKFGMVFQEPAESHRSLPLALAVEFAPDQFDQKNAPLSGTDFCRSQRRVQEVKKRGFDGLPSGQLCVTSDCQECILSCKLDCDIGAERKFSKETPI